MKKIFLACALVAQLAACGNFYSDEMASDSKKGGSLPVPPKTEKNDSVLFNCVYPGTGASEAVTVLQNNDGCIWERTFPETCMGTAFPEGVISTVKHDQKYSLIILCFPLTCQYPYKT